MQKQISSPETGALSGAGIASVVFLILTLLFGSVMIWALVNYNDQKTNVDKKVNTAVEIAKKIQKEEDERDFEEREKAPFRVFQGPSDFGSISFQYPKTWSAYVADDSDEYEVAFFPLVVPVQGGRTASTPLPLRIKVVNTPYSKYVSEFQKAIEEKELKSVPVEISGEVGNRLDGKLEEGINGSMVVFKVRDKTMTMSTEAEEYRKDFNEIILKTLTFNP